MNTLDLNKNKAIINHFDLVCLEQNNQAALEDLLSDQVINHAARPGTPNGKESFRHFLNALHAGLTDVKVNALLQVAENDLVVTRKVVSGIHSGNLFGYPATGKTISFEAIEIIRLENSKYAEHWVQTDMGAALSGIGAH